MLALKPPRCSFRSPASTGGTLGRDINHTLSAPNGGAVRATSFRRIAWASVGVSSSIRQDRNLGGQAISTAVGWADLTFPRQGYDVYRRLCFENRSLRVAGTARDGHAYLLPSTYPTAVRPFWGDLYTSFEWNHWMTEWSTASAP